MIYNYALIVTILYPMAVLEEWGKDTAGSISSGELLS